MASIDFSGWLSTFGQINRHTLDLPAPERKIFDLDLRFLIKLPLSSYRDHDAVGQVRLPPLFVPSAFLGNQPALILSILARPKAKHPGVEVEIWSWRRNILDVHSLPEAGSMKLCKLGDCYGLQ